MDRAKSQPMSMRKLKPQEQKKAWRRFARRRSCQKSHANGPLQLPGYAAVRMDPRAAACRRVAGCARAAARGAVSRTVAKKPDNPQAATEYNELRLGAIKHQRKALERRKRDRR